MAVPCPFYDYMAPKKENSIGPLGCFFRCGSLYLAVHIAIGSDAFLAQ